MTGANIYSIVSNNTLHERIKKFLVESRALLCPRECYKISLSFHCLICLDSPTKLKGKLAISKTQTLKLQTGEEEKTNLSFLFSVFMVRLQLRESATSSVILSVEAGGRGNTLLEDFTPVQRTSK